MGDVAHGPSESFWRAPLEIAEPEPSRLVEVCDRCEAEFIVGSRFCHNCGAVRSQSARTREAGALPISRIAARLRLSVGAIIAASVGGFCAIAAIAVGFVFSVKTVLDWQAVQLWRIEWLLGAIAAFLAGCLLQRKN